MSLVSKIENLSKVQVAEMQSLFGDYIVNRQRDEQQVRPVQCYKDDYVKLLISNQMLVNAYVVIDTHGSDLKLFDIRGL